MKSHEVKREVKVNILKNGLVEWEKLRWFQGGLKKMSETAFQKLKDSLVKTNFVMPFNVWEDEGQIWILDGHHRLRALKDLKREGVKIPKKLPANFIKVKDKKEAAKLVLLYSSTYAKITESGFMEFAELMQLDGSELGEVNLTDFKVGELDIFDEDDKQESAAAEQEEETGIGTPSSVHTLNADVILPSNNEWGIPVLDKDKIPMLPTDISLWNGLKRSQKTEWYLHIWQNKGTVGLDTSKAVLGFYTHDKKFISTWTDPVETTTRIIRQKWAIVLAPNFSLFAWMPKLAQYSQTYRTRWLGRFWQEAGIQVVPDVDWIDEKSFEFCLYGIPKNINAVSIQVQTKLRSRKEKKQRFDGIKTILKEINPKQMLVYGIKSDEYGIIDDIIRTNGTEPIYIRSHVSFASQSKGA